MELSRFFAYSDNCRRLLRETLAEAGDDVVHAPLETTSRYDSIAKIVAHTIGAEERWITMRLQKQTLSSNYEDRAPQSVGDMFKDWDTTRANTYSYFHAQTPESLANVPHLTHGNDNDPLLLTTEEVLFHILNHENYHRGQVVMALQQMRLDPPNFDYTYLNSR